MTARNERKQAILNLLEEYGSLAGGELRQLLGISRQAMSAHLRALIEEGLVARSGRTRGASYHLMSAEEPGDHHEWRLSLLDLDESRVYDDCFVRFNLGRVLIQQGRPNEGIAEFRELLRIDPTHAAARQALEQHEPP